MQLRQFPGHWATCQPVFRAFVKLSVELWQGRQLPSACPAAPEVGTRLHPPYRWDKGGSEEEAATGAASPGSPSLEALPGPESARDGDNGESGWSLPSPPHTVLQGAHLPAWGLQCPGGAAPELPRSPGAGKPE